VQSDAKCEGFIDCIFALPNGAPDRRSAVRRALRRPIGQGSNGSSASGFGGIVRAKVVENPVMAAIPFLFLEHSKYLPNINLVRCCSSSLDVADYSRIGFTHNIFDCSDFRIYTALTC
jgi:hypothetical protein